MRRTDYVVRRIVVGGKLRPITKYKPGDMARQKELYRQYSDALHKATHRSVYSYAPGRSNYDAALAVHKKMRHYASYVKLDIKDYFPHIDRERLRGQIYKIIPKADALEIYSFACCCPRGVAEGSPLSPALSNIYLRRFDSKMANRPDCFYLRYCDDILILTNADTSFVQKDVKKELSRFGLFIKPEKLDIGEAKNGVVYLGYTISPSGMHILPEKVASISRAIEREPDAKRRRQIAGGFAAYCRNARHLPNCAESKVFMQAYARYSGNGQSAGFHAHGAHGAHGSHWAHGPNLDDCAGGYAGGYAAGYAGDYAAREIQSIRFTRRLARKIASCLSAVAAYLIYKEAV